ncbi:cbb3-type cytochrome oxidase assembly protein CcoS [Shewanella sp. JM162201]|uniref:Cbb3-type cytochrome oxidase assembly protein CcoS n=1 Tax=Shewanella jiangmenensis TaxID=2837387 RepID=A0ABS5V7G8_9GAMM|nr:cbb3-type cytochrome oxidase assembly protein CcoS [Shewanella jiangmenensis]MBT1445913.1 cbb3-type cytochrome oxidase assembly protein CcoS [Shewanella jiangmenensis]
MSIIYVLIPIAMLFVLIAVGIFFWAVRSEQFDDLNRQGSSILFEDDNKASNPASNSVHNTETNHPSAADSDVQAVKANANEPH